VIDDASSGHSREMNFPEVTAEAPGPDRTSGVARSVQQVDGRLRKLVHMHFDQVWRTLRRFGVSAAEADDGAQRVFWVASQKLDAIEAGKERAFLLGTAYRVASDIRRSVRHRDEAPLDDLELADPGPGPEEQADRHRARALLDRVLERMPLEVRSVFVLFELEELTIPQIALMLELPIGTATSRLRKGREIFRDAASRIRAHDAFRGGST
jgi:RNA polymerase sigma-70 factor (ECF subfamily)